MRTRTDCPRSVRVIEHAWITLTDGCKLAARIWLPVDAEEHPVPAILEYIPYRKNDVTAQVDAIMHRYVAGHGYAAMRVDLRGSGDSDGLLLDEYLPQEQDDALEVLDWIATQPWCTGAVGMIGISWGGFNGLQVAARRPPALRAIITACSTDDRYADDVHYIGGCVLGYEMLSWASAMLVYNARPPDPVVVGDRWREMWLNRLEPGQRYTVTVRLNAIAHVLPAGHRWRVAVSPTYWPLAWPSPEPVTLNVFTGAASRLVLPARLPRLEDGDLAPFEPAEGAPKLPDVALSPGTNARVTRHDVATGRVDKIVRSESGFRLLDSGRAYEGVTEDAYTIVEGEPLSAYVRCAHTVTMGRGAWRTHVETMSTMSSDATTFHLTNVVDAYEGNVRIFTTARTFTVPRDLV